LRVTIKLLRRTVNHVAASVLQATQECIQGYEMSLA